MALGLQPLAGAPGPRSGLPKGLWGRSGDGVGVLDPGHWVTMMITSDPTSTRVPANGSVSATVPLGLPLGSHGAGWPSGTATTCTERPTHCIKFRASAWLSPLTSGTWVCADAEDVVAARVGSGGADWPLHGCVTPIQALARTRARSAAPAR